MRNIGWVVLALSFFVLASAGAAYGDGAPFPGETLAITGTGSQTSPCCTTASITGLFTIGSQIGITTDWTVTTPFNIIPSKCGSSDCSTLPWVFSLTFDASNDTLFGTAAADFTGSGGDSREVTFHFIDGNTTSDPFQNNDLTREALGDTSNDKSGTLSYNVSAVPEPPSALLLGFGLLLAGLAGRRIFRNPVPTSTV